MLTRNVVVANRLGLHARAAARLVNIARQYTSHVRLERADTGQSADGKGIYGVLLLTASRGTELRVMAEGDDEQRAVDALCGLIERRFEEEGDALF
ncbi:MAG: HPr family phosphocarrier protein [Acidobacteria bacterium]|nr:HPr family phosphocarrier protein [Acidobacteriota bacterium]